MSKIICRCGCHFPRDIIGDPRCKSCEMLLSVYLKTQSDAGKVIPVHGSPSELPKSLTELMDSINKALLKPPFSIGQELQQGISPANQAKSGKPEYHYFTAYGLNEIGKAFKVGADKHGVHDYKKTAYPRSIYINAALRHLLAYMEGEEFDPIDGQRHLGALGANALILLEQDKRFPASDDRFKE